MLHEFGTFLPICRGNIAILDLRADLLEPCVDPVHLFLFVEDEVCKFLLPVDQDQPVVVIGGAVIRLAFTDTTESPFYILIGDTVFPAEIFIVQAKLS